MKTRPAESLMHATCMTAWLETLCSDARISWRDALFRPDYGLGMHAVQVGINIAMLDRLLVGIPLHGMPDVPQGAVRGRQLSFLAGRLCAEHGLRTSGSDIVGPLGRGESGEALWPEGWRGSISHTRHIALAVVMPRNGRFGIGIDAEEIMDDRSLDDVLQVCAHKDDRRFIAEGAASACLAGTVMFCAKEAYYKAMHGVTRRFIDFDEISLRSLSLRSGDFCLQPTMASPDQDNLPSVAGRFVVDGNVVVAFVAGEQIVDGAEGSPPAR